MAIQNRRGAYIDFKPNKMVAGEWAIVQSGDPLSISGRSVYIAFESGVVKRMATYEDMQENIDTATAEIQTELRAGVEDAIDEINDEISAAQTSVNNMQSQVNTAIGSINTRMTIIESDYADLKDDNADELTAMQTAVDIAIGNANNARNSALEAASTALSAAAEAHEIIESGSVASVFGRAGIVTAQAGDYNATQITYDVGVSVADELGNKVSKSGDTITGDLYVEGVFFAGEGLEANYDNQTALGQFNDNDSVNVLEIGNGASNQERTNAFTVDWTGNIEIALDTTAAAGTTDGDLYAAITAIGWESEVID